MPIIKDKYKARAGRTMAIERPALGPTGLEESLTRGQIQAQETKDARDDVNVIGAGAPVSQAAGFAGKIFGYKIITADSVENILTLNPNEKINNIIISYNHGSATSSNISLFWSIYSPSELTFTSSGGLISSVEGGEVYRLLRNVFQHNTSLSLNDLCEGFSNIDKTIYFYGLASVADSEAAVFTSLIG